MTWKPLHFFAVTIAGWMNRQQQDVIALLTEENRILREKLGHKRIRLNDAQRCRLAMAAARLPRALLRQFGTLFSADTLLRWNRWFIARKYDTSDRRGKRGPVPTKANMIRKLVLEMAENNPSWGYGHIHGELKGLGYKVSWQTVRRVMLDHGLLPDPDKPYKTTWKTFLASHWESIAACDFFSVETTWLRTLDVLVFIELGVPADPPEPVHRAPGLGLGRPAGQKPRGSPRRASEPGPVPHSRPGHEVHGPVRRGPPLRRRPGDQDAHRGSERECPRRTGDRDHPGRVPRLDAHPRSSPS